MEIQPDDRQRRLLKVISEHQLSDALPVGGRVVRSRLASLPEEKVNEALDTCVPLFLSTRGTRPHETYELTLEGLVHTRFGGEASRFLEDFIRFLQKREREEPGFQEYDWSQIAAFFGFEGNENFEFAVACLQIAGLANGPSWGSGPAPTLNARVPDDIEEVLRCGDFSGLLALRTAVPPQPPCHSEQVSAGEQAPTEADSVSFPDAQPTQIDNAAGLTCAGQDPDAAREPAGPDETAETAPDAMATQPAKDPRKRGVAASEHTQVRTWYERYGIATIIAAVIVAVASIVAVLLSRSPTDAQDSKNHGDAAAPSASGGGLVTPSASSQTWDDRSLTIPDADQRPTTTGPLEVVSVRQVEDWVLDVIVRNTSDTEVVVRRISARIIGDAGSVLASQLEQTARYNLPLGEVKLGESGSIDVAHGIEGHKAERFAIALDTLRVLKVRITLHYDKHDVVAFDVALNTWAFKEPRIRRQDRRDWRSDAPWTWPHASSSKPRAPECTPPKRFLYGGDHCIEVAHADPTKVKRHEMTRVGGEADELLRKGWKGASHSLGSDASTGAHVVRYYNLQRSAALDACRYFDCHPDWTGPDERNRDIEKACRVLRPQKCSH